MKRIAVYLHVILSGLFISSCDDYALDLGFTSPANKVKAPTPGYISLVFGEGVVTQRTSWYLSENTNVYLINFDKWNYPNAVSIVFTPVLKNLSYENFAYAELFNVTYSIPVSRSEVNTNSKGWMEIRSENIMYNLPDKEIILAIRLRTQKKGVLVATDSTNYLRIFLCP